MPLTLLRMFGGLEETHEAMREVFKSDFGLDPSGNIELRKEIAILPSVWESSRMQLKCQESRSESSRFQAWSTTAPRPELGKSGYAGCCVEAAQGRSLKDREIPSKSLIAAKLEQIEDGAPIVEDLREVTSLEDAHVEAYGAVIDPASQTLRIRPGKSMTTPPAGPEDLRPRHRRLGLAWDFVRSRHSTRTWLPMHVVRGNIPIAFWSYAWRTRCIAGIKTADGSTAPWPQVLAYELELRKAAYRLVRDENPHAWTLPLRKPWVHPTCWTCISSSPPRSARSRVALARRNLLFLLLPPMGATKVEAKPSRCQPGSANGANPRAHPKANWSALSITSRVAAWRARAANLSMFASVVITDIRSSNAGTRMLPSRQAKVILATSDYLATWARRRFRWGIHPRAWPIRRPPASGVLTVKHFMLKNGNGSAPGRVRGSSSETMMS